MNREQAPDMLPPWVIAALSGTVRPLATLAQGIEVIEHAPQAPESAPSACDASGEGCNPAPVETSAPSAPKAPRKGKGKRKGKAPAQAPEGEPQAPALIAPESIDAPECATADPLPETGDDIPPPCESGDALAFYSLAPDSLSD